MALFIRKLAEFADEDRDFRVMVMEAAGMDPTSDDDIAVMNDIAAEFLALIQDKMRGRQS